ncbi:hypothetical protein B0H13DRAFT_2355705 [Mycena leptocephala]|nr:hypothetical protein B0H13DRAFT_2355705 [Mycena leptocephala]
MTMNVLTILQLDDVYNLDDAFNSAIAGPMADALESGLKRVWFQTTSEAFATLCQGSVYLVTEEEDIWQGSIWLTNEVNALFRSGAITEIVEVRPADIGQAYDHGGSVYQIPKIPYRGGQPPGAKPPRDASIQIPAGKRPDINSNPTMKKIEALNNLDTTDPADDPPVGQNKSIPATPPPPPGSQILPVPVKARAQPVHPPLAPPQTPVEATKIQGDCVAGTLPKMPPYSGPPTTFLLQSQRPRNTRPRINDAKAKQAATDYCASLASNKVVPEKMAAPARKPGIIKGAAENNGDLALTVLYDVSACPTDNTLAQFCGQDSTWGSYNKDYTLEGGVFRSDCGLWSMAGQKGS